MTMSLRADAAAHSLCLRRASLCVSIVSCSLLNELLADDAVGDLGDGGWAVAGSEERVRVHSWLSTGPAAGVVAGTDTNPGGASGGASTIGAALAGGAVICPGGVLAMGADAAEGGICAGGLLTVSHMGGAFNGGVVGAISGADSRAAGGALYGGSQVARIALVIAL